MLAVTAMLAVMTALAQTPEPSPSPSPAVSPSPVVSPKPTPNLPCMQAAVEKRDNAVIAAVDVYYGAVKTALQVRRDALKAAWGIANAKDRRAALRQAWDAFKSSHKAAAKALNQARKDAWKQWKADAKACRVPGAEEPGGGEGVDARL